jgi:mycothiol synthase
MIEFRAASVAEAAEICAVIRRAEAHDGVPRLLEVDELVEEFESDAVDLRESSRVAVADGEIVGIVYLYHRPAEAVAQRAEIQGALDPHWRQRGIGRELVGWAVLRAASVLTAIPSDLPRFVRWSAYEQDHSTHRLAARLGFTPVRWYDDLLRPLTDLPEPATIPGIRIEVWPADRDEEIRLTKNTAFLDHWGASRSPPASGTSTCTASVGDRISPSSRLTTSVERWCRCC